MDAAHPTSAGTTFVGSQPPSRAASVKHLKAAPLMQQEDEFNEPPKKDRAPPFVVILCLFQSLAGLLFGWESGGIAGVVNQADYQMRFGEPDPTTATGFIIPTTRLSIITSFLGLGALFGALLAGTISSRVGIKMAFMFSLIVFLIGIAVETSAQYQWGQIVAGRLIAGYGVGSLSMLAPLYQAECSPRHLRGIITCTYQLCATLGFLANAVNYTFRNRTGSITWRIPIGVQLVFGTLLLFGTAFSPESPRYFVARGNVDQARTNLAKLRDLPVDHPELEAEIQTLVKANEAEKALGNVSYRECFSGEGRMLLRTMIGILVQAGQQWSGVNFFSYGVKFFASAGISDSFLIQVILGAVNVISTFPGLWAVEHLGRRQTLLIGSVIMFTGQVVAGAVGTASPDGVVAGKILITFSCIFIFGFASTWGPLGWVVAAEQFPIRLAAACVSMATASNWGNNFLLAIITPYITDAGYGNLQAKITFIWAGAIVVFGLFVLFFVPETKGLSLLQVDEMYLSRVNALRSASWVPYGGSSTRNAGLKLETSHHEVAPKRALDEDVVA